MSMDLTLFFGKKALNMLLPNILTSNVDKEKQAIKKAKEANQLERFNKKYPLSWMQWTKLTLGTIFPCIPLEKTQVVKMESNGKMELSEIELIHLNDYRVRKWDEMARANEISDQDLAYRVLCTPFRLLLRLFCIGCPQCDCSHFTPTECHVWHLILLYGVYSYYKAKNNFRALEPEGLSMFDRFFAMIDIWRPKQGETENPWKEKFETLLNQSRKKYKYDTGSPVNIGLRFVFREIFIYNWYWFLLEFFIIIILVPLFVMKVKRFGVFKPKKRKKNSVKHSKISSMFSPYKFKVKNYYQH